MAGQNEATVKVSETRAPAPAVYDSSGIDENSEPLKKGGTPMGSLFSYGSGTFVQGNCYCIDCHSHVMRWEILLQLSLENIVYILFSPLNGNLLHLKIIPCRSPKLTAA